MHLGPIFLKMPVLDFSTVDMYFQVLKVHMCVEGIYVRIMLHTHVCVYLLPSTVGDYMKLHIHK